MRAIHIENLVLMRRRYRTPEDERRAFYRFICKIGWYSPIERIPRSAAYTGWTLDRDDNWHYLRSPCEQYRRGYPIFDKGSHLERCWRIGSDEAFAKARREHNDQCEMTGLGIHRREYRYRKRETSISLHRYERFHRAFGSNFRLSNLDMDDVPTCVLKLCVALGALRAEIRNQSKGKQK
jgi:hypothetical protein